MRNNKGEIMEAFFSVLKVAGIITVAVMAPNALQIFAKPYKRLGKYDGLRLKRTIMNMQNKGFVKIIKKSGETTIRLTKRGQKRLTEFDVEKLKIKRPAEWDRKWRLVVFDIPEVLHRTRKIFQRRLQLLGFVMLQKSVWVCPYPCEEQVRLLKNAYGVDSFINFMTVENIDIETSLIQRFNLL